MVSSITPSGMGGATAAPAGAALPLCCLRRWIDHHPPFPDTRRAPSRITRGLPARARRRGERGRSWIGNRVRESEVGLVAGHPSQQQAGCLAGHDRAGASTSGQPTAPDRIRLGREHDSLCTAATSQALGV